MAVELRRRGEQVPVLIMMDSRADVSLGADEKMPPLDRLLAEFGGVEVPGESAS